MKTLRKKSLWTALAFIVGLSNIVPAAPLGTAFTYQGRLFDGTNAATGLYDVEFKLFDDATAGTQVGSGILKLQTPITNGLFTVELDFLAGVFTGDARWLAIGVRTNGADSLTALTPRQPLTPSPYTLYAPSAGTAATATTVAAGGVSTAGLEDGAVTAAKIGGGNVVKTLNSLKDDVTLAAGANMTLTPSGQMLTLASPTDWHLAGNAGTTPGTDFLGTTDNQPLELWIDGGRALRLEPGGTNGPNVLAGWSRNQVAPGVVGAVIAGGGGYSVVSGGAFTNRVTDSHSVVGGGLGNVAGNDNADPTDARYATVGGGLGNTAQPLAATIGGGYQNLVSPDAAYATIGGGNTNFAGHRNTVIGGGWGNQALGLTATVGGGFFNNAGAQDSTIAGGNNLLIQAGADFAALGGGSSNLIGSNAIYSTIAGGYQNVVRTNTGFANIGGGNANFAGHNNTVIGGGWGNQALGLTATVGGGFFNNAGARDSTIAGGNNLLIESGADFAALGGGSSNSIGSNAVSAVIAGGSRNIIGSFVEHGLIGGGYLNGIGTNSSFSLVDGGYYNTIGSNARYSAIGGGGLNTVLAETSAIGGGYDNEVRAGAYGSAIPGGLHNVTEAELSLAAGWRANAKHSASFVWADTSGAEFATSGTNQFLIRAAGGVGIGTNNPQSALHVNGTVTASNFVGSGASLTGVAQLGGSQTFTGTPLFNPASGPPFAVGNATKVSNLNADLLDGLDSTAFWKLGGNSGTTPGVNYFGTADNQALELKVNGLRALRLEPQTYAENNLIAGAWVNTVYGGVVGSTISGGGSWNLGGNYISSDFSAIGGGYGNQIATNAVISTIGGGAANLILSNAFQSTIGGGLYHRIREDAFDSTIGGGFQNEIQQKAYGTTIAGGGLNMVQNNASAATIGGGGSNQVQTNANNSTIAGGVANVIQHDGFSGAIGGGQLNQILPFAGAAVIGGGSANTNGGSYATVPGGYQNLASGSYAFAAGRQAKANHQGAFVWADATGADFASTANNQFLIRASGNVGINKNNPATALDVNGTVKATAFEGLFSSGGDLVAARLNVGTNSLLAGPYATIAGGFANTNNGDYAAIAGGVRNTIQTNADWSSIGGGMDNQIGRGLRGSVIAGGENNRVEGASDDITTYLNYDAFIGAGDRNTIELEAWHSAIVGGRFNRIQYGAEGAAISGGGGNTIQTNALYSVIGGGYLNTIRTNANASVIAGGSNNVIQANASYATIAGGMGNLSRAWFATVGGGGANIASNDYATVSGGAFNTATGNGAAVPGGYLNLAAGLYSFAAGQQAKAQHSGTFVWADATATDFPSTANNQFLIRAGGNVGINKNNPSSALDVNGTVTATGFSGPAAGLTGIPTTGLADGSVTSAKIADNTVAAVDLALDASSLNKVSGGRLTPNSYRTVVTTTGPSIDTSLFSGVGFQYYQGTGEGAIMSSYNDGFGFLSFYTKSATGQPITKRMTIDKDGNVGIGTLMPTNALLDVEGSIRVNNRDIYLRDGTDQNHGLGWYSGDTTKQFAGTAIDGPVLYGCAGGALGTVCSGQKVALLWNSSGNVGIGTTSPSHVLHVDSSTTTNVMHLTGPNVNQSGAKLNFGDAEYVYLWEVSDDNLRVQANRTGIGRTPLNNRLEVEGEASKTTSGSWALNSDARIKQDIQPISGALDKLAQVRLVSFHYTDEYREQHPSIEDRAYMNVVAQEFQKVFPEAVKESGDKLANGEGILQVDTYPLTIYSAAAVQELNQKLTDELKRRDAENAELKVRLERLEKLINAKNGGAQ